MTRLLILISCSFYFSRSYSQTFYDINTIQSIDIVFAQTNWDYMLDTSKAGSEGYIMATSVTINGVMFDSVGVKYKGNSTYNSNQIKNPFHIELDTYKNQNYQGYKDIKLSNVAKDPSFVREVLGYSILRNYMHAPLSNYANVKVNGNLIGLYVSSESVSKSFVNTHFYSNENTFIKCNPPGGSGPGTTAKPNLNYLGSDSTSYYAAYEMNSTYGWADLIALTDSLTNNLSQIEKILDVDKVLWMLAFDNVIVNLDSYIGGFAQNYYLYKDGNGKFNCVVWDLNESFGTFSQTGTGNLTITAKQQMSHLLHLNDADWPLIKQLLSVPQYKRMYVAHIKTILNEQFTNNSYLTTAQNLQSIISASVTADPNKFFTVTQFNNNITTDVSSGMTSAPGLSNLMAARTSWLNAQSDFTASQPSITSITLSNPTPNINTSVFITATVTNTNSNNVYLGNRNAISSPFQRIQMFDDGLHNDGAAGDNVYGVEVFVSSSFVQYYVYAENSSAGIFSPERAEFEYYTLFATIPVISIGDVVINEILAVNNTTAVDPDGQYEDYIELYNTTNGYVNLKDVYLSDVSLSPLKWKFPDNATIAPNSYLIVWADNDTNQSGYHANFKLSSAGEELILSYANGTVLDQVIFPAQDPDFSYQRCPNGTGPFSNNIPTFGYFNCTASISENNPLSSINVFPNPSKDEVTIFSENIIENIELYNSSFQLITEVFPFQNRYTLPVDVYPNGVYLIKINKTQVVKLIVQH